MAAVICAACFEAFEFSAGINSYRRRRSGIVSLIPLLPCPASQWFYNSRIGNNCCTCCDKICRCRCLDDDSELPEESRAQSGSRAKQDVQQHSEGGGQDQQLPRYEESQGMTVPPSTTTNATGA